MIDSNDFADPSPPNVARDGREYSVEGPVAMEASAHSLALIPAGLEVVPFSDRRRHSGQSGKEALVSAHIHSGAETCESALQYDPPPRLERQRIKRKRLFRLRYGLYCAFFLLLILSIALGVGLGVGLGSGHSRSHSAISTTSPESTNFTQHFGETRIGGSIHGSYYSTNGAWNGTAFATSQQGLSGTAPHQPVLYFQHHSGDVRWMELMSDGSWTGGSSLETVANDAKNNTPISAVTWTSKGVNHTHIFYIDVGNTIKEFTRGSDSDEWRDGTIGEAALHPTNVDLVSMQACLADPDAPAIRLWYASSPSTYEEYLWRLDNGGWTYQQQWQGYSGVAGIACRILLENTMSYVAFVNTNSNVEVWYERVRDMSTKGVAGWTKTNISINEVSPTTSLVHTDLFYVESADSNHIHAYNITCYSDERGTTIGHVDAFALEGKHRVANSRFTATSTWGSEGEGTILFFEQDIGNDIAQSRRIMSREHADWTSVSMEIPKL